MLTHKKENQARLKVSEVLVAVMDLVLISDYYIILATLDLQELCINVMKYLYLSEFTKNKTPFCLLTVFVLKH